MTNYSHSRLETFSQCPRKYLFAYVERPQIEREETIEAFVGSRVHDALEWLYRERQMARTPTLEGLLCTYSDAWDREWHPGVRVVRAEYGPDDYRRVGHEALERYFARYAPFDRGITVGIEQRVDIPIDPDGRYRMVGYIDRVDKVADGVYEIHDYKTSGTLPEQAKFDADRQLALYQLAVQATWPDVREVSLVWHYLRFDTEIRSSRSADELEQLRTDTLALIGQVECCEVFDPRTSSLCDWCEYQALCPARSHLVEIRALAPEELPAEDGVALVNRYVEVEEQIKQLSDEKDRLKQAILDFGRARKVTNLFGQGHSVRIWTKETLKFPDREHPDRAAFERWLADAGLWDAVSEMSNYKLSKLFESSDLDEPARAELAKWGTPGEVVRLYPRKTDSRGR